MSSDRDRKAPNGTDSKSKGITPDYERGMTPEEARQTTIIGVSIVAVIVLVIAIVVGVVTMTKHKAAVEARETQSSSTQVMKDSKTAKPAEYVTEDGAIQWTQDGIVKGALPAKWKDTPKVDVYLDPICPGCGSVDRLLNPYYMQYLKEGKIVLRIHPITFLTNYSTDDYSGRAANAILRSLDADPSKTLDYITYLMSEDVEPKEGPDYEPVSDEQLRERAIEVGYTEANTKHLTDQKYNDWLRASTQYTINRDDLKRDDGTFATPIVTVNGKKLYFDGPNENTVKQLQNLIEAASPEASASPTSNADAARK